MEYALYQAYPNHPLHYPAINYIPLSLYECSPPKLENLQLMVHMPDQIQSILDPLPNNPSESQKKRLNPKQPHFDPIPMIYIELLSILV